MLASSKSEEGGRTELDHLIEGYKLCSGSEGKSRNTIDIVTNSVKYFYKFLCSTHRPTDVKYIGTQEIRAFALYLQQKRCFSNHPFSRIQDRGLSSHTVNCYLRSLRAFWGWLLEEETIDTNPFTKVRLPRISQKVIPTFSNLQLQQLLAAIDLRAPQGYRDYTIVLTLVDTALRASELTGIRMEDLRLNEGLLRVLGKGRKERIVPIGRQLQRVTWRYVERYRPKPVTQNLDFLFLTNDGKRVSKGRLESIIKKYSEQAGINGVRCSPHTLRHTAAISFLRNGGDVFSLQRMLGHSSLEMTRHYCELADVDVKRAHLTASPVDSLDLARTDGAKTKPRALLLPKQLLGSKVDGKIPCKTQSLKTASG